MDDQITIRFLDPFDASDRPAFEHAWAALQDDLPADADPLKTNINLIWASEKLYRARDGTPPVFALVEEGSTPLALIPLSVMLDRKMCAQLVGIHEHPTRLSCASVLIRSGQLERVTTALLKGARKRWKTASGIYLGGLEPADKLYLALVDLVGPARLITRPEKKQYYIDLNGFADIEEFSRGRSRNYRKNVNRGLKRLSEEGDYVFNRAAPGEKNAFEQMAEIDARTWRAREREGDLPATLLDFCEGLHSGVGDIAEGMIEAIEFNGQPIAMMYTLRVGDRLYAIKHTFDPEFASYQPVIVLMHHVLDAALQNGVRHFEMLTGSNHATTWASHTHSLAQDAVFFGSPLGWASYTGARALRGIKALRDARQPKAEVSA